MSTINLISHMRKLKLTIPQLEKNRRRVGASAVVLKDVHTFFFFFFFFFFLMATATAYESSQARGQIGAAAAGLHHSHHSRGNTGSELHLQLVPQLRSMPYP